MKICESCGKEKKSKRGRLCESCNRINLAKNMSAGNRGRKRSQETKEKIRQAHIGMKASESARANMSRYQRQKGSHSNETRKKISASLIGNKYRQGIKHTPETVEKMRVAATGRRHSPESIEKMRQARVGVKHTEETKQKMRDAYYPRGFRKNTSIEIKVRNLLLSWGIEFEQQHRIGVRGGGFPDFYLIRCHAVIECDGDYWHTLAGNAERDRVKNQVLSDIDIPILRLSETDIHKNWDSVCTQIYGFIMKNRLGKNWKSECAWLRKHSKWLSRFASELPDSEEKDGIIEIAKQLMERAEQLSRPPRVRGLSQPRRENP